MFEKPWWRPFAFISTCCKWHIIYSLGYCNVIRKKLQFPSTAYKLYRWMSIKTHLTCSNWPSSSIQSSDLGACLCQLICYCCSELQCYPMSVYVCLPLQSKRREEDRCGQWEPITTWMHCQKYSTCLRDSGVCRYSLVSVHSTSESGILLTNNDKSIVGIHRCVPVFGHLLILMLGSRCYQQMAADNLNIAKWNVPRSPWLSQ